ncbi:MAG: DUF951 domain-containing protein [Dehalococcoidia bacterium]|nr:DUF951 domain-containing protein [Dehalococcoidia bacterium]
MVVTFQLGDHLHLKKGHPCGTNDWEVTRLGSDVALRCAACGHRITMIRSELERRIKQVTSSPESAKDKTD